MFERPQTSYKLHPEAIDYILADHKNPIHIISHNLSNGPTLDVGLGSGVLARTAAKIGNAGPFHGIEPSQTAIEESQQYYSKIHMGLVEDFIDKIDWKTYSNIVLADVLEHTPNPLNVLSSLSANTSRSAKFFISVPNVSYIGVTIDLIKGNFSYTDSGLLERTHLRFFTESSATELIQKSNLYIHKIYYIKRPLKHTEFSRLRNSFWRLPLTLQRHSMVYSFLFECGSDQPKSIEKHWL